MLLSSLLSSLSKALLLPLTLLSQDLDHRLWVYNFSKQEIHVQEGVVFRRHEDLKPGKHLFWELRSSLTPHLRIRRVSKEGLFDLPGCNLRWNWGSIRITLHEEAGELRCRYDR